MARGRLHRRYFLNHLLVIACFAGVTLWLAPPPAASLGSVVVGVGVSSLVAAAIALYSALSLGRSLEALTRSAREIASGRTITAADVRAGTIRGDDELSDLTTSIAELSSRYDESVRGLRAEEHRLRLVLDGMSEGVALLSGPRIAFANPAFARLLEIRDQVEGRTPLEVARNSTLAEAISTVARRGAAEVRDVALPSGRVLQLRAAPLAEGSTVILLLDVTEARSLERMRREFVANASHELRTPVAAIAAVAETITSAPNMAAKDRARFERILQTQADRLGRLVKDLLDLSRSEGQRPQSQPVDLDGPLGNALAAVRDRAEAKRVRLDQVVPEALPQLLAEPTAVEQVLVNLLENALKYTPEGGRIAVRAQVVPATSAQPAMIALEVEDTGTGIPKEHLPRLFERFYRADQSRARTEGGTGLGLAIVKHLAQSHGGDASVSSTVGVGSTFRVTFPRAG